MSNRHRSAEPFILDVDISSEFIPRERVPVVRLNPETHQRELVQLVWGLVPSWAEGPSGDRFTHARFETIATKPAFRQAFQQRRCLVVVDSFALGKGAGNTIRMKDGRPFGIGAIWERWQQDDQQPVESCAIITTAANDLVMPINDRMPVIIAEEDYGRWLDREFFDLEQLVKMMQPFPIDEMIVGRTR
jgi:putative SOS response-associated peptidase YedK